MSMIYKFEDGKGYWAKNAANNQQCVVVAVGRDADGVPTFAKIREFGEVSHMMRMDGREFAQVTFGDGVWAVSAAVPADVAEANRVMSAVIGK